MNNAKTVNKVLQNNWPPAMLYSTRCGATTKEHTQKRCHGDSYFKIDV